MPNLSSKKPQLKPKILIVRSPPSNGANTLAKELVCKRITPERLVARGIHPNDLLVNWGSSIGGVGFIRGRPLKLFNHPAAVALAIDKLETLRRLKAAGVPVLAFSTSYEELRAANPKAIIFARTLTKASEGRGIKLVGPEEREPPLAPLYTAYFKKDWEVRVHVFCGEPIHVQQKRLRANLHAADRSREEKMVRCHANGWAFCENDFSISFDRVKSAGELAVKSVKALGLDFGAVDILGNAKEMVVCEVNTKPGIESTNTKQAYTNAIFKQARIASESRRPYV